MVDHEASTIGGYLARMDGPRHSLWYPTLLRGCVHLVRRRFFVLRGVRRADSSFGAFAYRYAGLVCPLEKAWPAVHAAFTGVLSRGGGLFRGRHHRGGGNDAAHTFPVVAAHEPCFGGSAWTLPSRRDARR